MYWTNLNKSLKYISAGSPQLIYAIDTENNILQWEGSLDNEPWSDLPGLPDHATPSTLDCASDGTLFVCDTNSYVYRFNKYANSWIKIGGTVRYSKVGMGSNNLIYGLGTDQGMWYYSGEDINVNIQKGWIAKDISAGKDDTLIVIGSQNNAWRVDDITGITKMTNDNNARTISVGSASDIMMVSLDNHVKEYIGEGHWYYTQAGELEKYFDTNTNKWASKPIDGTIQQMSHDVLGNCFIIVKMRDGTYASFEQTTAPKNQPPEEMYTVENLLKE